MFRRKRLLRYLLGALPLVLGGFIWWTGLELAAPRRRALQDYHREFLSHPTEHGVAVTPFTAGDGTPVLLVVPLLDGSTGERGETIRRQVSHAAAPGPIRGTLVLLHGRRGRKEDGLLIAERFCALGFRCLLPDLPGHGDHPAPIVTFGLREANLPAEVLREAATHFQFEPAPTALFGISMGGSVAIHAAAQPDAPWRTVIIVSSFDRLDQSIENNLQQRTGPILAPPLRLLAGWGYRAKTGLALESIQPCRFARRLTIPVLVAHGTEDRTIPIDSGRRLFASLLASPRKSWVEIPGAGHENVLTTSFPLYATMAHWLLQETAP
jgi:uncharacterized protein